MARHRYAARVVLLDPDNQVLLFQWKNVTTGNAWWTTPGGGLDDGERSVDGARRELREETGLDLEVLVGPIWDADHWFRSGDELVHQRERFFLGRSENFEPDISGFDQFEADTALGSRWWTLDELDSTSERVYPMGLGGLVRTLLDKGVPTKPLKLTR